jgi:hypothetical protein
MTLLHVRPCDTCQHDTWVRGEEECVCICHQKVVVEEPALPPASHEWVEFCKAISKSRRRHGKVVMTEEEKKAKRKEYNEKNIMKRIRTRD